MTRKLLNAFILDPAKYAIALFVLKTLSDGGPTLNFWTIIDTLFTAFSYWALLSANLLGETLHELKSETRVSRVSSIWTSPLVAAIRYCRIKHAVVFAIDIVLKLLLALFLQSLAPSTSIGLHAWQTVLATTVVLDQTSKTAAHRKKISVFDAFNIFIAILASLILRSLFPVLVYLAWICPSLIIGRKLKFPRGREILDEPIDLSYTALADMLSIDHEDDNLYFLALTELKTRILHRDANKQIAAEKFFANYRGNLNP